MNPNDFLMMIIIINKIILVFLFVVFAVIFLKIVFFEKNESEGTNTLSDFIPFILDTSFNDRLNIQEIQKKTVYKEEQNDTAQL